jgi:hypothetical protein
LSSLVESNVFKFKLDFDQWPNAHPNKEPCVKPFNGSLFDIRYRYKDVFIDKEFAICHDSETSSNEHMKIYKIAYEINLLPLLGMYIKQVEGDQPWEIKLEIVNRDVQLMDMMTNSYDIGIFKAEKVREVIEYKWVQYGSNHHTIGFSNHCFYIFCICLYIQLAYIYENEKQANMFVMLAFATLYPIWYEWKQFMAEGWKDYFTGFQNYMDVLFLIMSFVNIGF